jgi:kumamolisin
MFQIPPMKRGDSFRANRLFFFSYFKTKTLRMIRWAVLGAALSLAACVDHTPSSLPPGAVAELFSQSEVRDLGERAGNARVEGAVVLRDSRYDELLARVDAMADPDSPQFHHFLTFDEFMATYAPTALQQKTIIDALRSAGFSIDHTYKNRGVIDVSATTIDAEKFFSTSIHDFNIEGVRHFGNVRPIVIPASIARDVLSIELNDWPMHQPDRPIFSAAPALESSAPFAFALLSHSGSIGKGPGKKLPAILKGPGGGWGPYAVAQSFDFPVQSGWDGRGVTAGVMSFGGTISTTDLAAYLKTFRITRTAPLRQIFVTGAPHHPGGEITLDVETIAGLSPGAAIDVYVMRGSNAGYIDGFNYAVSEHRATAVSMSIGACESSYPSLNKSIDQAAANGSALGMTFSTGSGDQGPNCPQISPTQPYYNQYIRGVWFPASSPHFTSVGGNQSGAAINSTQAWNTCAQAGSATSPCTTGGGFSRQWQIPAYQKDVRGAPASRRMRNVPDVAFPAYKTYWLFQSYTNVWALGTSWSSPIYAALIVQAAQACNTKFGAANVTTYSLVHELGEGKITLDVVSGNNTWLPPSAKGYLAGPGYDNTTGLGIPLGLKYAAALCGKTP